MPDLKFTISTTAQGTGAKQTADELKKLTEVSKSAGVEIKSTAQEVDKATISKGKLSLAVQKLSHEFPALGAVASALKHPIVGIAAAIALLVREIFKQIEAQNKLAQESAALSASLTTLLIPLNRAREQAVEAKAAQNELADAMRKVNEAALDSGKILDRQLKQIDAKLKLDKQDIDNKEKLALAELELQRARGEVGPEGFERRRAEIAERFGGLRAGAEAGAEAQKQDAMAKQHFKALEDQKNAVAAELALREDERVAKERLAEFDRQEKPAAERRAKELEEAQAAEAQAQLDISKLSQPGLLEFGGTQLFGAADRRERKLGEARGRLATARAAQESLLGVGGQRLGRRAELEAGLKGVQKTRAEAIAAAAKAGTTAETTRQAVISSTQDQELSQEAARRSAETTRQLGAIAAQTAEAKRLADAQEENGRLQKQMADQLERQNREIRQILQSGANKTQ